MTVPGFVFNPLSLAIEGAAIAVHGPVGERQRVNPGRAGAVENFKLLFEP